MCELKPQILKYSIDSIKEDEINPDLVYVELTLDLPILLPKAALYSIPTDGMTPEEVEELANEIREELKKLE